MLSPKKITAAKGRPHHIFISRGNEDSIFEGRGKAVMGMMTLQPLSV